MTTSMAPSVATGSSIAAPEAVVNSENGINSKPKQNPPIVSPTPTEPLEVAKSKQIQSNNDVDCQQMTPTTVRTKINSVGSPVATPIANSNTPPKKKPEKDSVTDSHLHSHSLPSSVPAKNQPPKVLSLSTSLSIPQENKRSSIKSHKTKHSTKKDSSSPSSSSTSHRSAHPPLISRYCGCCGDLLTLKPYGIDQEGKDRHTLYHKHERIHLTIDKQQIQEAAETIQRNTKPKKPSKSTKASRKKKKLYSSKSNGSAQWHYHHNLELNTNHHQNEFLKNLPPWPQESTSMDTTILEGLMALKHAPMEEMGCSCWNKKLASSKSTSPKTKKLKAGTKPPASKAKVALKKKSALAKGATSLTSSPAITEVVSTKTIITKCPKTGKKIKKIVRTVKKLKKKLVKKPLPISGATGASPRSSSTAIGATKTKTPSAHIQAFSSLATPGKETLKQETATGKAKKRSHDDEASGSSDDDDDDDDESVSNKKRRRNDEKADLDLRERLMNCPLENGPLFPSQQELMELTTIRKRNALQTFYKRFNELRQFIVIFGDANVPQQFPENHSLGIWVNKMRMERKKWDTGSERTSLTERKIELLESIDFIWAQNHKGEIGWERRFQEIKKFKRKHGHCNVPTKSAENRALGRWVSTQRTMYKNYMKGFVGKSLTREEQERRIFLLLKEGFLFSMIPSGQSPEKGGAEQEQQQQQEGENLASVNVNLAGAATGPSETQTGGETSIADDAPAKSVSATHTASTQPEATIAATNSPLKSPPATMEDTSKTAETKNGEETSSLVPTPTNEAPLSDDKRTTATASPPPAPASSIAQVSVTTTPATTPSVSTTASPDRSPRQKMEEPESGDDAIAAIDKTSKLMNEDKPGIEMPVVPSLVKSVPKQNPDAEKSSSGCNETRQPTVPLHEQMTHAISTQREATANEDIIPAPGTPPMQPFDRRPSEKPQLITSDGLRIIVKIQGGGEEFADASRSSLQSKPSSSSSSVLSPSRRSGRARKPSARQLEAEKSPMRESILGR